MSYAEINEATFGFLAALANLSVKACLVFAVFFLLDRRKGPLSGQTGFWTGAFVAIPAVAALPPLVDWLGGLVARIGFDPLRIDRGVDGMMSLPTSPLFQSRSIFTLPHLQQALLYDGQPVSSSLSPAFWIVAVWAAGALWFLLRIAAGALAIKSLSRDTVELREGELLGGAKAAAASLGLRSVRLRTSPLCAVPVTWGLFRPTVLLPEKAAAWDAMTRRAVLLHELGHARNRDFLKNLYCRLVCALLWFLPPVHRAYGRLRTALEISSDKKVVEQGLDGRDYAMTLLTLARSLEKSARRKLVLTGSLIPASSPSGLERRITELLSARKLSAGRSRLLRAALLVIDFVIVASLFALSPVGLERRPSDIARELGSSFGYSLPTDATGREIFPGSARIPIVWPTEWGQGYVEWEMGQKVISDGFLSWIKRDYPGFRGIAVMNTTELAVVAAADGIVGSVGCDDGYWTVTIRHDGGLQTCYSHMSDIVGVYPGDAVVQGRKIGTSGWEDGDFWLLYSVTQDTYPVNPMLYLEMMGCRVYSGPLSK